MEPAENFSGHVVPEAQVGGPIALVQDGDKIIVDASARKIDWLVDEETKEQRWKEWQAAEHPLKVKRGVLLRYARDVQVGCFRQLSDGRTDLTTVAACECWSVLRLKEGVRLYESVDECAHVEYNKETHLSKSSVDIGLS